jgi:hypothetical protein
MTAITQETWTFWFVSLPENEGGNTNREAFTELLNSGKNKFKKVKNLTDSQNNVFLAADRKKMIKIFHSPKNFRGTLLGPSTR